jgi:uncharacterized protein DUF4082/concanavalin A-like lectin/glucanase superfamily protein/galactose oxidase-like protein/Big-like domain-containing protein/purple acid phosphatase-like protein/Kelch motif protein
MRTLRIPALPVLIAALLLVAPGVAQAQGASCPCTLYQATDAPLGNAVQDATLEVGVKVRSDEDGYISAVRFYKQPNNTGTHVGHVWSASGQLLGTAAFENETASGWQEANLATPIPVTRDTTYVVSYHSSLGFFAMDSWAMSVGRDRAPLHAPADSTVGGNGVYRYGPSGFPDQSFNASSYWVDAVFAQTPPADSRAPQVTSISPANGATSVPVSSKVTVNFDEPLDPSTVSSGSLALTDGAGTLVSSSVTYDAQTRSATLTPSLPLQTGKTYTVRARGGPGGIADVAGNPLAADVTASFSTPVACPCTLYAPTDAPFGGATQDRALEVGVKLRSDEDGWLTSVRFYKQDNNTGTHVGHVWSESGQLLGEAEFENETASGWQQAPLPTPVPMTRDTTYIVSYHSSAGFFAFDPSAMALGVNRAPLHAPADSTVGGNGVYRYGPSGFPNESWNATSYWVDGTFERTRPPDTRAPRIASTTPDAGAAGVPVSTAVKVKFDEALDPATVNAGSIAMKDGSSAAVVASVTYDDATRTATLTPLSPLSLGKQYTVTVLSGNAGVTDVAGNRLAADKVWSFSTPAACPCTVFKPTAAPPGSAVHDQPVELGMKFRSDEDGYITSLRFYKQANNTGTHVGHLWSATGQLLAAAPFTNETASGWQSAELPNPVPAVKDTTYIASYHSSAGNYAFDPGFFTGAVDNPPMRGLANSVTGGNGVYHYGASAFPDTTYNATNYWVDAAFDRTVPPDTRGPTVTGTTPASGAIDLDRGTQVTASFDEPLRPASISASTFTLRDADGAAVPATVTYDDQTRTARLAPQAPLAWGTKYTATLKSGANGLTDAAGNPLAADSTWSFTTATQSPAEGPGGPILVMGAGADRFASYYAEILRGEGLNEFSTADGPVTATALAGKSLLILGAVQLTDAEVSVLQTWVGNGGNLIAMRPDKKLAPLLGLTDAGGTLSNGYMQVDPGTASGAGIDPQTLQFHGTADRYTLNGSQKIASLYSDAVNETANPAVSLRDVGGAGGQAAAFTYDLARSVVYTRQGNPAWAGQKRDDSASWIRSVDLFYGGKAGDIQPDWVDPSKIDVPQADEQQRLLANLITEMNRDAAPLPRFWYLPRGNKAAVVLTGDDHNTGGTRAYFDRLKSLDPPGCSVADWECPRATSYMFLATPLTDLQALGYERDGFELALHQSTGCADFTPQSLENDYASQLGAFAATWPSLKPPTTNRTHCITWSDWASQPKTERRHGIRFDTNYYYIGPPAWLLRKPGLMTGSGFPQRFADTDGSMIDVYQAMTQVSDEANEFLPTTTQIGTLLDHALGPQQYWGAFTVILHSDYGDHRRLNDLVADAQQRHVPVVTSAQMLDWVDGRNGSAFGNISYSNGTLGFSLTTNSKARGLQAMLPARSASGPLSRLTRGGQPVSWTRRTVKGVDYVVFDGAAGSYTATYANDTTAPDVSQVNATADAEGHATVSWKTDEPSTSLVEYGRSTALGKEKLETAEVTSHEVELTGLAPDTTYRFRVTSADSAGNSATSPATGASPASFSTPPGALVDSRTDEFAAGTQAGTRAGQTLDGIDGELQLTPALGEEFNSSSLPDAWTSAAFGPTGHVSVADGAASADGAVAYTKNFYDPPRVLEFTATFRTVNDQAIGLGNDLTAYPMAAFTTGNDGDPLQIYAQSGAWSGETHTTPVPSARLGVPHRFRIEWRTTSVDFYVDGVRVAQQAQTDPIEGPLRPVFSDFGLFGAVARVDWLRMGGYAASGTTTSRVLDSGPGANQWQTLTAQRTLPTGTSITFETRSGGTSRPDATWSAWQPVGTGGAIASPAARFIQYRATLTTSTFATPTLDRVQITYGAGSDGAPREGTVAIAPSAPTTAQTVTATPSGFSDPDGDPLTYRYQWLRNGTEIPGATGTTLNLATAGAGDKGDKVRVEVYATDGRGAASDPAVQTVTVANTPPTAGTATIRPASPSTNDVLKAVPAGFADVDNDALTYRYQWYRNGSPIAGATARTLDLAVAGNGDLGETIAVDVTGVDTSGATSPTARSQQSVTGTNSTPVEGTVSLSPASPKTTQTVTATPAGFRDPDGDALTYAYKWFRNGTAIPGATAATLDLSAAGAGDRGDALKVEVTATDTRGATSDPAEGTATVANTAPAPGTASVKPTSPSSDDYVTATASGFSDADGDALSYRYQWFRNGSPIGGANGRTLDLSQPGNGDPGDTVEVDVTALDGSGGTSSHVRASQVVATGASHAVASYGFEEPVGNVVADESGSHDGDISGATRSGTGRFGRALSFDGKDDIVTVPDDSALRLTTGMTLEAWVKPTAATAWRNVIAKESNGGAAYALYANSDADRPAIFLGGTTGVSGPSVLDANRWTHLAATFDGATLRLFVNGAPAGTQAVDGEMSPGEGPLTFGANHVWGEHFRGLIDEVRVYNRALSAGEITSDMGRSVVPNTPAPPPDPGPDAIGSFAAPQQWPIVPVHMSLTSDGRVAAWDGFEAALNSERVWDPGTGAFIGVPSGRNLFCAGEVTGPDGRLYVFGGHEDSYQGLPDTHIFNPQQRTWASGPDMSVGRWYPTVTQLPDGRIFVISGDNITLHEPNMSVPLTNASNTLPSIYDPKSQTWTDMPSASRRIPLYPFMFLLPDGKLFDAGPDTTTRTFDLNTRQWSVVGQSPISGHSAVMYRPGKILKSGTWADPEFPGRPVTNGAATIDMTAASPAWRSAAPMEYPRSYHTLTVLPDGKVLATGGSTETDGVDEKAGILAAEMWDPDTDTWTTMAAAKRPRLYHSSALLLPDGRVLLAGGGAFGGATNENNAEIYSPPYLSKGPRPAITGGPANVNYGQQFTLQTPDAGRIRSATMVRMGSVTHNLDMDQRFMNLTMAAGSGSVQLQSPSNPNVAPPGMYMVFLLDDKGVPSVGHIVKVEQTTDTAAPTQPTGLSVTRVSASSQRVAWAQSTDNVGVAEYRVYRSTTPNFTPAAANRVATVATGTNFTDTGLSAGTYYYKVIAADGAGNTSPASNEVVGDLQPPTVSVTAPAAGATVSGVVTLTAGATDAGGVQSVQLRVDGTNVGAADTSSPYSTPWDSRAATNGSHTISAVATDALGNTSTSTNVTVTLTNTERTAAYGFEEASGSTAVDNFSDFDGTISGATRVTTGRFGSALSFDGVNDSVSIPNNTALTPNAGLTISAWVNPTALGAWRPIVAKERSTIPTYGLYAAASGNNRPTARVFTTSDLTTNTAGTFGLGVWTHEAMTWNGTTLRLFVNGAQVASRTVSGPLAVSNGVLRLGGDSVRGEWFAGRIDEVRVYGRPLTAAEITADMNAPVGP